MDIKIDPRTVVGPQSHSALDRKQRDLQSLKKATREFETLYVMEMFKAMRKSVPKGGLFKEKMSTEIFQEMLDMETARAATKGKGLGIADAMYNQMAPLIENKK
jgi:flagellar protein FlgJ